MLWKVDYSERFHDQAVKYQQNTVLITFEQMLTGEDVYSNAQGEITYTPETHSPMLWKGKHDINYQIMRKRTEDMSTVRQKFN